MKLTAKETKEIENNLAKTETKELIKELQRNDDNIRHHKEKLEDSQMPSFIYKYDQKPTMIHVGVPIVKKFEKKKIDLIKYLIEAGEIYSALIIKELSKRS